MGRELFKQPAGVELESILIKLKTYIYFILAYVQLAIGSFEAALTGGSNHQHFNLISVLLYFNLVNMFLIFHIYTFLSFLRPKSIICIIPFSNLFPSFLFFIYYIIEH